MPVRHDYERRLSILFQLHLDHLGRAERIGKEVAYVVAVRQDVNLLALQLVHDVLDAEATQADAGADGVDAFLPRHDGHLGAGAWLASDGLDLDHALVDFGHLTLEQAAHEVLVGAGEDEFGAAIALRHFREIELQRGVGTIALVGDLLPHEA